MGCLLLGFLVCGLDVTVVSAGEEDKMRECVRACVRARACGLVTQWNDFSFRG